MSEQLEIIPEDPEVEPVTGEEPEEAEQRAEAVEEADGESAAPEDDAEQGEEKPKRRSRAEERINTLTREKYEAAKKAENLRQQVEQLHQYLQSVTQQQPQQTSAIPRLEDFDYDTDKHAQAVNAWHQEQIAGMQRQQQEAQQQAYLQQQQAAELQRVQAKLAEGAQKYPDFQAKVNDPSLPSLVDVNPAAFQAVMESELGADVAYYLASNPTEVYGFSQMNPVQAIRKVAQIEQMLSAKGGPAGKPPPKPPTKLKGNSEAVRNPADMSTEEYIAWRNKTLHKR